MKGFSLIELIISIVVISICAISLATMYQEASRGSYKTEATTVATILAEDKLEETLMDGYSGVSSVGSTAFDSPFGDYTYQVTVNYVNAADLETSVDPTVTDYRTIEVQVDHAAISHSVTIKSLLTNH